jgi:hypothetical protein
MKISSNCGSECVSRQRLREHVCILINELYVKHPKKVNKISLSKTEQFLCCDHPHVYGEYSYIQAR